MQEGGREWQPRGPWSSVTDDVVNLYRIVMDRLDPAAKVYSQVYSQALEDARAAQRAVYGTDSLFANAAIQEAESRARAAQRASTSTYSRPGRFARWTARALFQLLALFLVFAVGGMLLWGLAWLAINALRFLLRFGGFI